MAPVVCRVGQGTANFGTGICVVPKDIWATGPSGAASAAWMQDRSTRCGASGHMPEKGRGQDGVCGRCPQQGLDVGGVGAGLAGGNEAGAEPRSRGAGGQDRCHPACGGDAPGCHHGDIDCAEH